MKNIKYLLPYVLSRPFLYLIENLPFRILDLLAFPFYVLLYYIVGYRGKVVDENLRNSFPEKNAGELKAIKKQFYKNLCDVFIEIGKTPGLTAKEVDRYLSMDKKSKALLESYTSRNKGGVVLMGHYGNWEYPLQYVGRHYSEHIRVLYKPLRNPYFDHYVKYSRTRFNPNVVPANEVLRYFVKENPQSKFTYFIADQAPMPEQAIWCDFLHRNTAFFGGGEKLALRFKTPVLFYYVLREKRHHYKIYYEKLYDETENVEAGEITKRYAERLEAIIREHPAEWLWTHRRWKNRN